MVSSPNPAGPRSTFRAATRLASLPFLLVHAVAVVGIAVSGWSWAGLGLAAALYVVRMFFITAGYHRYFSHRTYKTSRAFQLLLAIGGATAAQKGPIWWAARHRQHHRHADRPGDVHSPIQDGFWWSHMGWFLGDEFSERDARAAPDLARFPELVWLDRHYLVPPVLLGLALFLAGGWHALLWGFCVSTTLLWHGTFLINSVAHVVGTRPYATRDSSRNNAVLAVATLGEGWHNNHHHFPGSASQGFRWWELDLSYRALCALSAARLVWGLRTPPPRVLAERRRRRRIAREASQGNSAMA